MEEPVEVLHIKWWYHPVMGNGKEPSKTNFLVEETGYLVEISKEGNHGFKA